MEKRLRLQLTISVAAVLFVMLGFIVMSTAAIGEIQLINTSDDILGVVIQYEGAVPSGLKDMPEHSRATINDVFDAQYFAADVDAAGNIVIRSLDTMPVLEEDEAKDLVARVWERREGQGVEQSRGSIDTYRYRIEFKEDGSATVALLDLTSQMASYRNNTLTMGWISLLAVVGVTLVFGLVSKRIVEPIVKAHETQRQFVVDAGHDLRTPISIISADTDVLSMDIGADNEWLVDIKRQVSNMSDLTESLIVLSRAATTISRDDVVDISAVVGEEVSSFKSRVLTEHHEIEMSGDEDTVIKANRLYITRMVGALLDNALKYARDDTAVQVVVERHTRRIEIRVSNEVASLDPLEVNRWFDRFYQSEKSRTHRAGGFGIGLAMVRAVAEAHGGKARAQAQQDADGGGVVTITISLPAQMRKSSIREG
ncbi:MAG: sensor histidine kinase [Atopobiaceae bacterium]